jgi:hypothetical protein
MGDQIAVPQYEFASTVVTCPDGKVAVGGGFQASDAVRVLQSVYVDSPAGWAVEATATLPESWVRAFAVCADA